MKRYLILFLFLTCLTGRTHAQWNPDGVFLDVAALDSPLAVPDDEGGAWLFYTYNYVLLPPVGIGVPRINYIDADGVLEYGELGNPVDLHGGITGYAKGMVPRESGGFVVLYSVSRGIGEGLYAQAFDQDGVALFTPSTALSEQAQGFAFNHANPRIACTDGADGAWCLYNNDTFDSLFIAGMNSDGSPKEIDQPLLFTQASMMLDGVITEDGEGGVWVAWGNGELTSLYLQHVLVDGSFEDNPLLLHEGVYVFDLRLFPDDNGGLFIFFQSETGLCIYHRDGTSDVTASVTLTEPAVWDYDGLFLSGIQAVDFVTTTRIALTDQEGTRLMHVERNGDDLEVTTAELGWLTPDGSMELEAIWLNGGSEVVVINYAEVEGPEGAISYTGHRYQRDGIDLWEGTNPVLHDANYGYFPQVPWVWPLSTNSILMAVSQQEEITSTGTSFFHITPDGHVSGTADVRELSQPQDFLLSQPYPNPFNGTTRIDYTLPASMTVRVAVYDLLGREVALLDQGLRTAGIHSLTWNGEADATSSGVYFIRMNSGGRLHQRRVVLVK